MHKKPVGEKRSVLLTVRVTREEAKEIRSDVKLYRTRGVKSVSDLMRLSYKSLKKI